MKTIVKPIAALFLSVVLVASCAKKSADEKISEPESEMILAEDAVSDSISTAATHKIEGKEFIRTAQVDMEVKDVYDATIFIEKKLQEKGGFVVESKLENRILDEETYTVSDEKSMVIRKSQMQNNMQVRVPTAELGNFLQTIHEKNTFLNVRNVSAKDVSASIQMGKWEKERTEKTEKNINQLAHNKNKVEMGNENHSEKNRQKLSNLELTDNLKYSLVNIDLKEAGVRVAEITIPNHVAIDNQYKTNFAYEAQQSFIHGFYLMQKFLIFLINLWPFILVGIGIYQLIKRRKNILPKSVKSENQN